MCREEHGREAEAMRWFRQAAHHGQASSWFHIGSHYEHGLGVDKDPAKAAEAYRNGAEKGSSDAQQSLGIMAAFGRGVPQDPAQAAYWLRLAADDEKPLACGVLGHCYLHGLGVQQDDGEAFVLLDRFDEAYDREKPDDGETSTYPDELVGIVYNGLGELYADGRGGPVDIKEGIRCFQAAAELGNGNKMSGILPRLAFAFRATVSARLLSILFSWPPVPERILPSALLLGNTAIYQ